MVWRPGLESNETAKIRWEVIPYTQGNGLDVGCGGEKLWRTAIGVDSGPGAANVAGNVAKKLIFDTEGMDYVFSSHCLEDLDDPETALKEWWRVVKVGGHLVLYLPHAEFYPRRGKPGSNLVHKHDFLPEDIVKIMQRVAPDWALVENQERNQGDEYSFLQVYRKRPAGAGQGARLPETDPARRCIVMRFGGFGDVLVAGSTFPHLKAEGWHLTVITGEKGAELLKHDPNVDRVDVVNVTELNQGQLREYCGYLRGRCARFVNFSESFEGLLLANPHRVSFWWPHEMRHRFMNANYMEAAHSVAGVPQDVPGDFRQKHYATPEEIDQARAWRTGKPRLVVVAASGSGINKFWPGLFEYCGRLVKRHRDLHVVVLGGLCGGQTIEHERLHQIAETWPVRRSLALALQADLVIGQETGLLNAVALEAMPKIVLLSHSSAENLTKHWVNTTALHGDVACYPCHRLHADWRGCTKDPATQLAACQTAIAPMTAIALTELTLGIEYHEHREAA